MAEQKKWVPDPPAGLHGPTADAPGSILEPAMRKAIREVLTPALVETFRYLAGEIARGNVTPPPDLGLPMPQMPPMPMPGGGGGQQPGLGGMMPPMPMPMPMPMPGGGGQQPGVGGMMPPMPAQPTAGGMPFPHGDMDLSFIAPNVVTPNEPRTGQGRQFYFLNKPNVPGGG